MLYVSWDWRPDLWAVFKLNYTVLIDDTTQKGRTAAFISGCGTIFHNSLETKIWINQCAVMNLHTVYHVLCLTSESSLIFSGYRRSRIV